MKLVSLVGMIGQYGTRIPSAAWNTMTYGDIDSQTGLGRVNPHESDPTDISLSMKYVCRLGNLSGRLTLPGDSPILLQL